MKKVYVLIHNDRHSDTDVKVYKDRDEAIGEANTIAYDNSREGRYDIMDIGKNQGWVFFAEYSEEGDHVIVAEREVK